MVVQQRLIVVTTCTERKTVAAPNEHQLRTVDAGLPVTARAHEWVNRLAGAQSCIPAESLYSGDHWSTASQLPAIAEAHGWQSEMWVASAGYGFIRAKAEIASYAATFSPGSPDSVSSNQSATNNSSWWHELAQWSGPRHESGRPRTVADLAVEQPEARVLVAASAVYLQAMCRDLTAAASALRDPHQLLLVCGGPAPEALRDFALPVDARLQHLVGGTRLALNARVAKLITSTAETHAFDHEAVTKLLTSHLSTAPPLVQHDREQMSDISVEAFITMALRNDPSATKTRLLRQLRDSGSACEQKRFGKLFADIQGRTT